MGPCSLPTHSKHKDVHKKPKNDHDHDDQHKPVKWEHKHKNHKPHHAC